jgi:hypothetical protein
MADFGQSDEVVSQPSATTTKSSWGSSDEVVSKPQKFGVTTPEQPGSVHNFIRSTAEAVAPGYGGLAGAGAGASAVSPLAEMALAGGGPAGPIAAGAIELLGAGAGAYLGAEGVGKVQNWIHEAFFPEDFAARQQERQENPWSTFAGGVVGGATGLSPKAVFDPAAKVINTATKARAASAVTQAGVSAGTQLATEGKVDPLGVAASAVVGAALPGVNRTGKPFVHFGEAVGGGAANLVTGKGGQGATKEPELEIPKEYTTPEQRLAYLEKVKKQREDTAPLVQTAIRNKETGEIELMGPKHDQKRKEETKDTHEEGFVDDMGRFHERQAAVDQAKRSGQIPQDHVLENPQGERPGLHSGDLRKAGDSRFEVTEDKPAGTPATKNTQLRKLYDEGVVHDENMGQAKTITELAAHISAKHGEDSHFSTTLAALVPHLPKDLPVTIVNSREEMAALNKEHGLAENSPGFFNPEKGIFLENGRGTNSIVASHEIGHAVLSDKMRALEGISEKIQAGTATKEEIEQHGKGVELLNEIKELLQTVDKNTDRSTLTPEQIKALNYALGDVHEFVSDGLFNPGIMKHILAIEGKRPSGFLSRAVAAIGKFFGMSPKDYTGLHQLLRASEKIAAGTDLKSMDAAGTHALASRLSQEIHDDLEKEGIAVAHSSPHRFGMFDWIKHALSGEGAMVKGAGTYLSTKDSTDAYYREMSKEKLLNKYLEDHPEKAKIYNDYSEDIDEALEQEIELNQQLEGHKLLRSDAEEGLKEAKYIESQTFEDWKQEQLDYWGDTGRTEEQLQQQFDSIWQGRVEDLKKAQDRLDELSANFDLRAMEAELDQLKKYRGKVQKDLEAFKEKSIPKMLVPTYHSTLKAKPEELLKWDEHQQSSLVNKAFKNLGIDSAAKRGTNITAQHMKTIEEMLAANGGRRSTVELTGGYEVSAWRFSDEEYTAVVRHNDTTTDDITTIGVAKAASLKELQKHIEEVLNFKSGEELYEALSKKLQPSYKEARQKYIELFPDEDNASFINVMQMRQHLGDVKASIALAEQGVVGNMHYSQGGKEREYPNYVAFDDTKIEQNFVSLASRGAGEAPTDTTTEPSHTSSPDELAKDTTPEVAKAAEKVDVRSIPNEEEFYKHATEIYKTYGEEEALKFFEDYNKNLFERSIPVPNNNQQLDDMFHKMNTFETKDRAEMTVWMKEASKAGIDPKQAEDWFFKLEDGQELPPEASKWLQEGREELVALVRKAKGMGLDVGEEFTTGQSRVRLFSEKEKPGWKETLKKMFSSDDPMGSRVADQADAAIERKVYQLNDGRVVEIHRQPNDISTPRGEVKKGTEIWEWKDGKRTLIGHSDDLSFKLGDKLTLNDGKEATMVTGNVRDIEAHSPYRYSHDPFLSQAIARMGLRKMVREAEAIENLKKSDLFKEVGHSPEQDLKTLPKGWKVPSSIEKIPQLRGWHFDPKTAAIIEDFAKVWDNTMYMKLSNALVKNMMLNPVPHMFNEVMHLWNARGFSGWVDPRKLSSFKSTARQAWNDVGNQSKFYREIMREGGSILGADPRNKQFFDKMMAEQTKQMFGDPVMERNLAGLAKKLGTSVGNLYNGISKASQKAMWFTRDVMYVQYVREIMSMHEKRTGSKMELKDAIAEAERHMPNYRMPSEVLGSRALSKGLKDPRLAQFSRYHYGMVKSLANTIKDIDPRNLKSPEGRKHFREGVDSMLAIGVAMGVLYPLMDMIAESMFGEGAEQRRAGPYHLIQAGADVAEGKKDASALIWPVLTFNPVLLSLGQLALNRNVFTGKNVYHPEDSFEDILGDVGAYATKQVPQAAPVMSAVSDEGGDTQFLAKQLDIKSKTNEQRAREQRAKQLEAKAKKGRDTKRSKGTYRP